MNPYILIIVISLSSPVLSVKIDSWRNYNGEIPDDALQAGLDTFGNPIYIGQGFFVKRGLLPGTLHPGSTKVRVSAAQKVYSTEKLVKILCSNHHNKFEWRTVNSYNEIALLTNVHLVEGGIETSLAVYIGRAQHEGSLEIAKIYNVPPNQGLSLPNREGSETRYDQFEILVYNLNNTVDEAVEEPADPILKASNQTCQLNINLYT